MTAEGLSSIQQKKAIATRRLLIEGIAIVVFGIVLMGVIPSLLPAFQLKLLGRFLSLAIVALGVDLIWGYTGLLSLGQGIFFALGGYGLAMHLSLQLPEGQIPSFFSLYGVEKLPFFWYPYYSFPLTLILIVLVPGIVAGILGYVVFRNRIKGVYFSILTQAALLVFFNFFNGQQKLINGTNGLKTDTAELFGQVVGSPRMQWMFYQYTVLALIAVYLLCRWLTSGRFGRLLVAIRDDENRVRFSGYDPTWFKVLVFAVSGAITGIAGALSTIQSGIITPSEMEVAFSIEIVIWVAVGGRATLVGALIGTLLVQYARVTLSAKFPEAWLFFQGFLFLLVVTVLPDGIIGWLTAFVWPKVRSRFGFAPPLMTYPSLETDPEVLAEREQLTKPK
ncbi:urea ABC transporter permease subunit UrtC [Spirulina sp. CCNP1310]|uniref:urea ABC transporter permease subunit UrtC n=1 Tax=Spirulina sp. CCNP1310 TaxID=3110249 RepID=UPI002B1F3150|nr:urea ABC transporter permease subunit UrtC [Spirulina sp. CCNP1310]MEA5419415.1 urea ABC transporter permease subunit UrtC [Spirulina sp. CCNP1310]